eukprot:14045409-Ditylum_brightwellii.AAC.1
MKAASRIVYFVDQQRSNDEKGENTKISNACSGDDLKNKNDQNAVHGEGSLPNNDGNMACKDSVIGTDIRDVYEDDDIGVIEYGCLGHDKVMSSTLILENVLIPLLTYNNSRIPTELPESSDNGNINIQPSPMSLSSSLQMNHAKKFISRVHSDPHYQTNISTGSNNNTSGCILEIPDFITSSHDDDIDAIVDDYDSIQTLELVAEEWYRIISSRMAQELKEKPKSDGPLGEIKFWRRRYSVLTTLNEQTKNPSVQKIIKVLRIAGVSPVYRKVSEAFNELNQLYIEAADNAKFLVTLERYFQTLVDGSLKTVIGILPSLVDYMRIVWTVSRHYNRDERLVPLMERVAWQLMSRVREHINVKTILRSRRNQDSDDCSDVVVNDSI